MMDLTAHSSFIVYHSLHQPFRVDPRQSLAQMLQKLQIRHAISLH